MHQRSIKRSAAALPEAAPAPAFQDLLTYHQTSAADSGVTYLYRSSDDMASVVESAPVASPSVRRYDTVSYLQVDWDSLQQTASEASIRTTSAPRGLSNVYLRVLDRVERTMGASVAGNLLLLLRASRNGLTQEEMVAISGCTAGQAAELALVLQNHLMPKGGRLTLLNDYIGSAIESRYAGSGGEKLVDARERIADYLENLAFSIRVAEELPWQFLELGALDRLELCVTTSPVATTLCQSGRRGDLCLYWNALQERVDLTASYMTTMGGENGPQSEEVFALLARYYAVTSSDGGVKPAADLAIQITHPTMEGQFPGMMQMV